MALETPVGRSFIQLPGKPVAASVTALAPHLSAADDPAPVRTVRGGCALQKRPGRRGYPRLDPHLDAAGPFEVRPAPGGTLSGLAPKI